MFSTGEKVRTLAGNRISSSEIKGNQNIYLGGIKLLSKDVVWNGELWVIEKPLWSEPLDKD